MGCIHALVLFTSDNFFIRNYFIFVYIVKFLFEDNGKSRPLSEIDQNYLEIPGVLLIVTILETIYFNDPGVIPLVCSLFWAEVVLNVAKRWRYLAVVES